MNRSVLLTKAFNAGEINVNVEDLIKFEEQMNNGNYMTFSLPNKKIIPNARSAFVLPTGGTNTHVTSAKYHHRVVIISKALINNT